MLVHRKGTDETIKRRLRLSQEPSETLRLMLSARAGRAFAFDLKTRRAARVVLRVRGEL